MAKCKGRVGDYYILMVMVCIRCGKKLNKKVYKSLKYCSQRCQKLYLKSQWRKRNRERLNEYHRQYRRKGSPELKTTEPYIDDACLKCGGTQDLQVAHVKPLWAGGTHANVVTLCRPHHHAFDDALRTFWQEDV